MMYSFIVEVSTKDDAIRRDARDDINTILAEQIVANIQSLPWVLDVIATVKDR